MEGRVLTTGLLRKSPNFFNKENDDQGDSHLGYNNTLNKKIQVKHYLYFL